MLGVLALQGDFAAHAAWFARIGVGCRPVRRADDLVGVGGLVLPGGESTTMLRLLEDLDLRGDLVERARRLPVLATCAGAILLAREVTHPAQPGLGLLDATVERNGWGPQIASTVRAVEIPLLGDPPHEAVFIRAPRFRGLGPGVEVLARRDGEPVLVRQGDLLAATFHPELTADLRLARAFAQLVAGRAGLSGGLELPSHQAGELPM